MKRTYCDHCEKEITLKNAASSSSGLITRVEKHGKPTLDVQVLEGFNGRSDDVDFCKYCIIDAVNTLDDRPREE